MLRGLQSLGQFKPHNSTHLDPQVEHFLWSKVSRILVALTKGLRTNSEVQKQYKVLRGDLIDTSPVMLLSAPTGLMAENLIFAHKNPAFCLPHDI